MPQLAALYLRASTTLQEESVAQQRKELSGWKPDQYTIVQEYQDEFTGTTLERPGLLQLIHDVHHGPAFSVVLMFDMSRLARTSPRKVLALIQDFKNHGVDIVFMHSRGSGKDDVVNIILQTIEAAEAEEHSITKGIATLRGTTATALQGRRSGGSAPYGYKRIAVHPTTGEYVRDLPQDVYRRLREEKVTLDKGDPDEVDVLKQRIFPLAREYGAKAIAHMLNMEGIPCPRRGRWRNLNQRWSQGTVRDIVRNPVYRGALLYRADKDSSKWVVIENAYPAIVTKEEWELANAHARPYVRRGRHSITGSYLLTGCVVCDNCGFKFHGVTSRMTRPSGEKYSIGAYIDSGFHSKGSSVCVNTRIRQDELEGKVLDEIRRAVDKPEYIDKIKEEIRKRLQAERINTDISALQQRLVANRKAVASYQSAIESGADVSEFTERVKALSRERRQLETQLAPHNNKRGSLDAKVKEVQSLIREFATTFDRAPLAMRKSFVKKFVDKIVVHPFENNVEILLRVVPASEGVTESVIVPLNIRRRHVLSKDSRKPDTVVVPIGKAPQRSNDTTGQRNTEARARRVRRNIAR